MITRDVTIQNNVGLHARPATFFIQKANNYKSSIWVSKDERKVNAFLCSSRGNFFNFSQKTARSACERAVLDGFVRLSGRGGA